MSTKRHHTEWLSLVEVSGPFLSMPVLERVFPHGLDAHDPEHFRSLRVAYDEWSENQEGRRPNPAIHKAWIDFVMHETLGLPDEVLAEGQAIPQTLKAIISEHGETLRPDIVVRNPEGADNPGKARLLVQVYPLEQDLEKPVAGRHWKASPSTRMMELLHANDVRLGLVTNGEWWMLVDAPRGDTTGFASWYASLWLEEAITLRAFRSLLGVGRFFSVADNETLEAMLAESATHQQEVTDQLGLQVRQAVEVLIQSLDRADQDHGRELLGEIPETVLYESALTVMMRLVFLFSAEERELLLLGDPMYDQHYAVSTLVAQLQEAADEYGEEVLERRLDAWCRLLSTFRAVYGGVQHDRMKLPAYAGNLFNPDRFPFLEGRKPNTTWKNTPATPLPVNNRTVLHLLRSLQYLEMRGEARRLSFRALDIEQIGHVYEGLLDHTAKRATEPVLGLSGAKGKEPEVALAQLEWHRARGEAALIKFLKDQTGRSESALRRALELSLDSPDATRMRAVCGNNEKLFERLLPFAALIRNDTFDRPVVIRKGSVYVTAGTDRRSSGTHYTPRSLTEPIVQYTLEPLVYDGPAKGQAKEAWKLRSAREILDRKICDMACGSGAFLVQACRYLAERLVEAWEDAERSLSPREKARSTGTADGTPFVGITPFGAPSTGKPGDVLIPKDADERMIYARRIVAGRCLYGVDKSPLAAEMAKLSLWLLTLQKDKPFTFLDHAIRCGDSLVGIANTHQLTSFSLDGSGPDMPMFTDAIKKRLDAVRILRRQIAEMSDNCAADIERKALMLQNAEQQTTRLAYAANLLLNACWEATSDSDRKERLKNVLTHVEFNFKDVAVEQLEAEGNRQLRQAQCPRPFHWTLEFPEVFMDRGGFDGMVGNPPFLGGTRISTTIGSNYLKFLQYCWGRGGRADLCTYFFLRAYNSVHDSGGFGLLATNTIAEGDSREISLEPLVRSGATIYRAVRSRKWPGSASLEVAHVWIYRGSWHGAYTLDEMPVKGITPFLTEPSRVSGKPHRLAVNLGDSAKGVDVCGAGFFLQAEQADALKSNSPKCGEVLFPYLNGSDLNSDPQQAPSRWIINFFDWPLDRASAPKGYSGPVAADYPRCLRILEETVKAERLGKSAEIARAPWWRLWRPRMDLVQALSGKRRVLVRTRVSEYHMFAFVSTGAVFSDTVIVFPAADESQFAVLQATINEVWSRLYSSTLETRMLYTLADAFETFPFPSSSEALGKIGTSYHEHRRNIMLAEQHGLTKTYSRFHDRAESNTDIQKLRELHVEMDYAVATAYGWTDINLRHGFHETKQGVRFTIGESARPEVLDRLLKLNHERYAEEAKQGLHDKGKAKKPGSGKGRKKKADNNGLSLFGDDDDEGG